MRRRRIRLHHRLTPWQLDAPRTHPQKFFIVLDLHARLATFGQNGREHHHDTARLIPPMHGPATLRETSTGTSWQLSIAPEPDRSRWRKRRAGRRPPTPPLARKGRGATINPPNRFDPQLPAAFDDGWDTLATDFAELPPLPTTLTRDATRSVISLEPVARYRLRPRGQPLSRLRARLRLLLRAADPCLSRLLAGPRFRNQAVLQAGGRRAAGKELRKPGYVPRPLALGSNTDPYQPIERTLKLTRAVLEVLDRFNHPVSIVTKSAGVLRDLDILRAWRRASWCASTCPSPRSTPSLPARMEPRAATPARRLQAIARADARRRSGRRARRADDPGAERRGTGEDPGSRLAAPGARTAGYVLLRLPHELKQMFEDWLHQHFPDRARHVLSLIRETRAGALNDARFGHASPAPASMPTCWPAASPAPPANGDWNNRKPWILPLRRSTRARQGREPIVPAVIG